MKRLIPLLLLVSCGKSMQDFLNINGSPIKKSRTDPTFNSFVESFSREFNVGVKIPIIFKNIETKYAGVCLKYSSGYREIQINPTHWKNYSLEQREQLIYHELGHCVFNRGHNDRVMEANTNCPDSIMRSYMFSLYEINNCYVPEYSHYMEEL
jgi:hypothetical protein